MAESAFATTGLSPAHAFILMSVNRQPGIQPTELAAAMQLERSTVTRFVDSLEAKHYLKRESAGRRMHLYPEKSARALDKKLRAAWSSLFERYASALGIDNARKLTRETYSAYKKIKIDK
ncbi:MAG TPA: MarR family transcriptional regulator [Turneriella sp.]|nr:MarR family transcriptional regulator [Turneriella sp.]